MSTIAELKADAELKRQMADVALEAFRIEWNDPDRVETGVASEAHSAMINTSWDATEAEVALSLHRESCRRNR